MVTSGLGEFVLAARGGDAVIPDFISFRVTTMKPAGVSSPLLSITLEGQTACDSDAANSNVGQVPPMDFGRVCATRDLRWAEHNHAAIKAYNQRVVATGVFSDDLRCF